MQSWAADGGGECLPRLVTFLALQGPGRDVSALFF
jgi:hypothetical protein